MHLAEVLVQSLERTSGCTEPAAIAYCGALAGHHLDPAPDRVRLAIDRRTYKNAFGAGIPGGGERRGTQWALALGLSLARPELRLSLFSALTKEVLEQADGLMARDIIDVELKDLDGLLIHLNATARGHTVEVRLQGGHTRLDRLTRDGVSLMEKDPAGVTENSVTVFEEKYYDPAAWPGLVRDLHGRDKLRAAIRQAIADNMAAARHGLRYIHREDGPENLVMGAIYARMNGDPIPVTSCAGSGNKGLTCMIPVVTWARERMLGPEAEIRAVILAVFLTTLITSRFGEVSSVCGAQYAAGAGVIAGLLYLKERLDLFHGAYNNFVSAIGGGFCDGAKGSCSMRGNAAVTAAMQAIDHAENGFTVSERDGFLGPDFRTTLEHLVQYNPIMARFEQETIKILQEK